jgi:uncharacterized protein (DUF427 family)
VVLQIFVAGRAIEDAIWTYVDPYPAVKEIAGYLAFYSNLVEITSLEGRSQLGS